MVSRGSSVPQNRRTTNPFMTTTSSSIGINLQEPYVFDAPKLAKPVLSQNQSSSTTDLTYKTSSSSFGDGLSTAPSKLSQRMDKKRVTDEAAGTNLAQLRERDVVNPQDCLLSPEQLLPEDIDVQAIAKAREEHPLYATSNREIGTEKAQLKVETERRGIPNKFTASFNGFHYRDYGLNTAVTKSKICDHLDPN